MKKTILVFFLLLSFCIVNAQESSKYLKGAVPVVDGKVVFSREIKNDMLNSSQLFNLLNKWAEENYPSTNNGKNRILISNPESNQIAILGGKDMVFKNQAFVLDKAFISYQLLFDIKDSVCLVSIKGVKYNYEDTPGKPELLFAEKMITDEVALNKDGTKLNRYYDKFRVHTIDSVAAIFNDIQNYVNGQSSLRKEAFANEPQVRVIEESQVAAPVVNSTADNNSLSLSSYRLIAPDKITGNIIKLMSNKALLVEDNICKTISNGGIGMFAGNPAVFIFSEEKFISKTYTVAFYTVATEDILSLCEIEGGLPISTVKENGYNVFSISSSSNTIGGAWMIIECENIISQSISSQNTQIGIGKIINVWIK